LTFSIIGYDPSVPAWGIAIASRFLAVGARTCWGAPGAGVVVLQANLNALNGADGLELLRQGAAAGDVIEQLMAKDFNRDRRQMAIIDAHGTVATYTGKDCNAWAGSTVEVHCSGQGNTLFSDRGCAAMVEHFMEHKGALAWRLANALAVGDAVAGDRRGRQSAALLVVRPYWQAPLDVFAEPTIDLRVDDHTEPFGELKRLLEMHDLLYLSTAPDERLAPDEPTVRRLQRALASLGYYQGELTGVLDAPTRESLETLARRESLRNRLSDDACIDRRVLDYLERKASTGAALDTYGPIE
jgi:uncharacterized Ntn-hydrolase superfamily protein